MENRSQVSQKFLNAVLEKKGEDHLDRSFEKLKYYSITVKKRKKQPTHNKMKEE
jgi:hypothetical protein